MPSHIHFIDAIRFAQKNLIESTTKIMDEISSFSEGEGEDDDGRPHYYLNIKNKEQFQTLLIEFESSFRRYVESIRDNTN